MLNGLNSVLNMKTPVVAFDQDQEKVLEGRGLLRECEIFAKVVLLYCTQFTSQGPGRCCGRCSTATRMSGLGVAAWGVAAAAQCQTRGCPGYRGPQGGCGGRGGDAPTSRSDTDSE